MPHPHAVSRHADEELHIDDDTLWTHTHHAHTLHAHILHPHIPSIHTHLSHTRPPYARHPSTRSLRPHTHTPKHARTATLNLRMHITNTLHHLPFPSLLPCAHSLTHCCLFRHASELTADLRVFAPQTAGPDCVPCRANSFCPGGPKAVQCPASTFSTSESAEVQTQSWAWCSERRSQAAERRG